MIAVSIYCSVRLLASRALRRRINVDVNVAHVTMGVAMAGMLVPALTTLPTGVWEAVFVGLAMWFSWRSVRFIARHLGQGGGHDLHHVSHYLTHLVMSCAMLYMYLAAPTGGAANAGGMSMGAATGATANFVGLPLFFLIVLCASAVWHIDSLSLSSSNEPALVSAMGANELTGGGGGAIPQGQTRLAQRLSPSVTDAPDGPDLNGRPFMAPRLELACHVAMCITMGYMLILML
ncbi:MAG TPA: DUF5134 domain-containing protein [Acidimicrobiales bacterium]|nr:DUF5134 domain-containing protein [Acidimicrobiales bacterium]